MKALGTGKILVMNSLNSSKCGVIAIIGRPSAGKSTLLNTICGYKVSIVASSPQTTRNSIRGIVTRENKQIIFIDTPGYHLSEKKINHHMTDVALSPLEEADLILYVVDSSRPIGAEEQRLLALLSPLEERVFVAINKTDHPDSSPKKHEKALREAISPRQFFRVSATKREGIDELLSTLLEAIPEGDILYPEEYYTDQEPEFRVAEIIREQTVNRVGQEIPHALYVRVDDMEVRDNEETLWIRASILTEKESHKGIIVGKGGRGIRDIRKGSQKEIGKIFYYKRIHLLIQVKRDHKWRSRDRLLEQIIH